MGQKQIWWGTAVFLILLLVVACTAPAGEEPASSTTAPPTTITTMAEEKEEIVVDLPDMGGAPEFLNDVWLNSDGPVTLAAQRGKVVLLEFWTFG